MLRVRFLFDPCCMENVTKQCVVFLNKLNRMFPNKSNKFCSINTPHPYNRITYEEIYSLNLFQPHKIRMYKIQIKRFSWELNIQFLTLKNYYNHHQKWESYVHVCVFFYLFFLLSVNRRIIKICGNKNFVSIKSCLHHLPVFFIIIKLLLLILNT